MIDGQPEHTACLLPEDAPLTEAEQAYLEAFAKSPLPFQRHKMREGYDFGCPSKLESGENRARVKIFTPRSGTTVAFVYKDSLVVFSTDRFAYGAVITKGGPPSEKVTSELLHYIESGLHPEQRPADFKRAFPFDIPR